MRYRISFCLIMVIILFSLTLACEKDDDAGWEAGESANIGFNEKVDLKNTTLSVNFHELVDDSRCPSDVICVDAGEAEVVVTVVKDGDMVGIFNLILRANQPEKASVTFSNFNFTLLDVLPFPNSQIMVSDEDYIIVMQAEEI